MKLKHYRCMVADPPWPEYGGGGRGAQNHYPLMTVADIRRVMCRQVAPRIADDAHGWIWVTDNYLPDGLAILAAMGFRYVRTLVWTKAKDGALQIGLGQYLRGAHELCLFGVRGKAMVPPPSHRMPSVIIAPRERHSAKPRSFLDVVELVSACGPRLEVFARAPRMGWDALGDELGKHLTPGSDQAVLDLGGAA